MREIMARQQQHLEYNDSQAVDVVLRLLTTKGIGDRTIDRILLDLFGRREDLAGLLALPPQELALRYGIRFEVADSFLGDNELAQRLSRELVERGVHVLLKGTSDYPVHLSNALGGKAPPVLFALGRLGLLQMPAVGFCGSRRASDKGLSIAADCARILATNGINVISGYAHGVDLAAHRSALEVGGVTTMILAEGILGFKAKSDIASLLKEENHLVVSAYSPGLPWSAHQAMARNRVICGLSHAMIAVESGTRGGTFDAGKAALELRRPLFVVDYAEPAPSASGNKYLLERGAQPLRRYPSGQANLEAVLEAVEQQRENGNAPMPPTRSLFPPEPSAKRERATTGNKEPARISPYINRNLFSDHFLEELLPQDESWHVHDDSLMLAMQATSNLYAGREEEWSSSNEAQLEHRLVRPALQALGHHFEVQPSLPTTEAVRRPDYAFFVSGEERRRAKREHEGEIEYFDKAIAIGDAKRWDRPLDKGERGSRDKFDRLSPSWQIDYYLRMSGVKWGVLTNGRVWRLYNQETSFRLDICYEIDLPRLLAAKDLEAFKYFYLFFRRQAFVPDGEGLCFLDRVYQGSLEYAQAVGDDLKENVYKAVRLLAEGFLRTRGNDLDPARDLDEIHANSLVLLYRLLFINYAEDRRLLPRDNRLYKESYGLVSMEREIASKVQRRGSLPPLQVTYCEKLRILFDLINQGTEALGIDAETMEVPPYNGGLFNPEKHPFLEQNKVEDKWLAEVIDLLARSQGEGVGRGFVDYSSLDVRHLGSIYEGLLEYKLRVADEEMVAVRHRGKEQWIPASEAGSSRVLERVQPGSVYLATDRGERKATGSYYTPDYIVKYIVEHTVGPLVEERMKGDDSIDGILSLKVLDPAMGSGHFLVEATDRLAHALVEALGGTDEQREEEDVRWARREVVERCIYGVDLNPLAVELAKLSLWLHTVAEGKPLSFLDHHLKVGNSLIGAWVDDLASLPVPRKRAKQREIEPEGRQMNLFGTRLHERLPTMLSRVLEIVRRGSQTLEDMKAKGAADQAVAELKAPFKAVADLWVSTYSGNQVAEGEYQEALEHIGEPAELLDLAAVERAWDIAEETRFFHWELEFPEVFYEDSARRENPGFDAVVGNPPYVRQGQLGAAKPFFESNYEAYHGVADLYVYFFERAHTLLRGGGEFGFISSRKFIVADYGVPLRRLLATRSYVSHIINFGDLPVFEEVTAYPAIILFQKAEAGSRDTTYVEVSSLGFESLDRVVADKRISLPSGALRERRWLLTSGAEVRLLKKLEDTSRLLKEYCSRPVRRGVLTGYDHAFIITKRVREQLIKADARSAEIIKPMVAGEDVQRYQISSRKLFLIFARRGVAIDSYPAVRAHLSRYRCRLQPKRHPSETVGRKPGKYQWYEIQDTIDYYADFEQAKIVYPEVSRSNRFTIDHHKNYPLKTVFSIPAADYFLLAILNSSLLETYLHTIASTMRGGYYMNSEIYVGELPIRRISFTTSKDRRVSIVKEGKELIEARRAAIRTKRGEESYRAFLASDPGRWVAARLAPHPEQSDVIHDVLAALADQMSEMNEEKQEETTRFLDWLEGYTGLPVGEWRLKTIVKAYWKHGWDEMQRALRQNRKAIEKASGRNVEGREAVEAIETEFEKSVARLKPVLEQISSTDRLIDLIVYRLYGLTEEEVAIAEESLAK